MLVNVTKFYVNSMTVKLFFAFLKQLLMASTKVCSRSRGHNNTVKTFVQQSIHLIFM